MSANRNYLLGEKSAHLSKFSIPSFYQKYLNPTEDLIVTTDINGDPLSMFKDMRWDISAREPNGRNIRLNFCAWDSSPLTANQEHLLVEMKKLMLLIMYVGHDNPLSPRTLMRYANVICYVGRHCDKSDFSVKELLSNESHLSSFINLMPNYFSPAIASLLKMLDRIGTSVTGYSAPHRRVFMISRHKARSARESINQYAPLPTRILSELIKKMQSELEGFRQVADAFFAMLENIRSKRYSNLEKFYDFANQAGLTEYCQEYGIDSRRNCSSFIYYLQLICKLTIHTFTGMRSNEAETLPFNCLKRSSARSRIYYELHGKTTKLGIRDTYWVTSEDCLIAVDIAKKIALSICRHAGVDVEQRQLHGHFIPLFVSTRDLLRGR